MQSADTFKQNIQTYLKAGAPYPEGVRLFLLHKGNKHPFSKLLKKQSPGVHQALVLELCRIAGISNPDTTFNLPKIAEAAPSKKTFRQDFPFLSLPTCPPELKILAANKITAYYNFVNGHSALFGCNNNQEQFNTVKHTVENYIENRLIHREFDYYKKHNTVLGIHPIFKEFQKIQQLRKLSVVDLVQLKLKLEHNIWRIKSVIKKNKEPHLLVDREKNLQQKQNELAEVERILKSYQ